MTMSAVAVAAEPIAVIVNKDNNASLSSSDVNDIYRGIKESWSDGKKIQVVNYPANSEVRSKFYGQALGTDAADEFFSPGSPVPFKSSIRKSASSVLRFVSRFDDAIGYVSMSEVNDSVKVVFTIE